MLPRVPRVPVPGLGTAIQVLTCALLAITLYQEVKAMGKAKRGKKHA